MQGLLWEARVKFQGLDPLLFRVQLLEPRSILVERD